MTATTDLTRFDPELEKSLVADIETKDEQIAPLAEAIQEMHDAKGDEAGWSNPETNKALAKGALLRELRAERHEMQTRLDNLRFTKPLNLLPGEAAQPSALERFLRNGASAVESEELAAQAASISESNMENTAPKGVADFTSWAITEGVSSRQKAMIQHQGAKMLIAGDQATGSAVVPPSTIPTIVDALAAFSGAMQICQIMDSKDGKETKIPQIDATTQKGRYLASEGTTAVSQDTPALSQVSIGSHTLTTDYIDITREMIEDADVDIEGYLIKQLARRAGRAMNEKFTVGTGTNEPEGFLNKARERTLTSNSTISFPRDLIRLAFDIDDAYFEGEKGLGGFPAGAGLPFSGGGKTAFTFNRATEASFLEATDNQGRPLWSPNIQTGKPDMFQGFPYVTNSDIPKVGANAKTVAFGNFDYHVIRMVKKLVVHSFYDSGTALTNSVRILGWARNDAKAVAKPYASGDHSGKVPSIACIKMGA